VEGKEEVEALAILNKFSADHCQATRFDVSSVQRKDIWASLHATLVKSSSQQVKSAALDCCRLLSREKNGLNEAVTQEMVTTLLNLTGIESHNSAPADEKVALDAAKVLSNLLHQSPVVQTYCTTNGFLSKLLSRIKNHSTLGIVEHQIKVFDLRLLFLFTALCPDQRDIAKHNHDGVLALQQSIQTLLEGKATMDEPCLEVEESAVICETLKVIFNLTVNCKPEDESDLKMVAATVNRLLRITVKDTKARTTLVNNCINVVTNLEGRRTPLEELLRSTDIQLPMQADVMGEEGAVLNSVCSFVDFLAEKLELNGVGSTLKEDITPVLSVLYNMARALRPVRKYLKTTILPPLQASDLKAKPEEGNSLKSRLVSLLTNTTGDISTMVAELLFVLCKENVGRLIKHTGYGNAAGLLARRGLMAGGRGKEAEYSEEEESDTEEYKENRHKVNPVTGCEEKPGPSPLDGMSEEQKEYEAMQLVNLMDKMTRTGLIQPCRVGEDGRPEAVDHVLQLQEAMQAGHQARSEEDDDSD